MADTGNTGNTDAPRSELPLVGSAPPPPRHRSAPIPAHGPEGTGLGPHVDSTDAIAHVWPGPHSTGAELADAGRDARKAVPRRSHGDFTAAPGRDPLAILAAQATTRVPDLVPVRHARMAVSPFTFFRGAAAVMAADLAANATTPLHVQICGDAHLLNFGLFGTPERHLAFDVNDFDETLPGPFDWDVKRLAASVAIAASDRGFTADDQRNAAGEAARSYHESITSLAALDEMACWYTQVNVDELVPLLPKNLRQRGTRVVERARKHTSWQAVEKLTTHDGDQLRIADDPPLITHLDDADVVAHLTTLVNGYLPTLSSDRRALLRRFRVIDVARKVVGVGSVGTRCYIVLLAANSDDTPLFMQVKQAEASVLEPFVGRAAQATGGERVVDGQRLMQASSDIFLGWGTVGPYHFYLRQLHDMKGSIDVENLSPGELASYARACGYTLARSHARSGTAPAISAYLGSNTTFADAIANFAVDYVAVNAADHAAMVEAIADGRLESTPL